MLRNCFQKCVSTTFDNGQLNRGNGLCVDRCVSKFLQTFKSIGENLKYHQGM
jgi:hypothetical protein